MQQKIVVFGKGGIGKSTITSNLAALYALKGRRVLLVGCDPKHDTTVSLTAGVPIRPAVDLPGFMDLKAQASQFVVKGSLGVDCVESGGPEPGIGCAGRGISRTIEMLESCGLMAPGCYDVILFDVLGDVVCGGFAAPLRLGFAEKVLIVASEELMALYAANNIARAIRSYSANGIALCGLVANLKDPVSKLSAVERFASLIGTRVLSFLPRDPAVRRAEYASTTAVQAAPASPFAQSLARLAEEVWALDAKALAPPAPLSDRDFHALSRREFEGRPPSAPEAPRAAAPAPAPVHPKAPAAPAPLGGGEGRLEKELAAWAQLDQGSWVDGPHARQWGDADQWRSFFAEREAARNADQQVYLDAPIIGIAHEDLECHYATPYFNDGYPAYFNFPWLERNGLEERFTKSCFGFTTDLRDQDVVQGGSKKLEEAIGQAIERKEGKAAILVTSTCIPTVIGDDAKGIIDRHKDRAGIPILFSSPAAGQELNVLEYFFRRVRESAAFKDAKPLPDHVNMIGFPVGPARDELEELLRASGIRVNAWFLPRLDIDDSARFAAAAAHVLYPNPAYGDLYEKLFGGLGLRLLRPGAPYGVAGTRAWLAQVAGALGRAEAAERAFEALWAGIEPAWRPLAESASRRRLAFVLDAERARRIGDPAGLAGVPLVSMIKEMGFGVDYLIFVRGEPPKLAAEAAGRHTASWFRSRGELDALLSRGAFDAAYSEYFFDRRLTRAGKAQFSLPDVEAGAAGALRTLERLERICRWPLYKRYGAFLGPAPARG